MMRHAYLRSMLPEWPKSLAIALLILTQQPPRLQVQLQHPLTHAMQLALLQ